MANPTGPVTLLDTAKFAQTKLERGVLIGLVQNSPVLDDLKIQTTGTRRYKWNRITDNFPKPGYGAPGIAYGSVKAVPDQLEATVAYFGAQIDVDKRIAKDSSNTEDPRSFNLRAYLQANGFFISDQFVNGDPTVITTVTDVSGNQIEVGQLPGLKFALDNPGLSGLDTSARMDAGGVDISASGNSPTNARKLLRILDDAIDRVQGQDGMGVTLYAARDFTTALGDVMRNAGAFSQYKDQFGRTVTEYGNVKIKNIGQISPSKVVSDSTTSANKILGWENVDGTRNDVAAVGSRYQSAYLVKHGTDNCMGVSQYGLTTADSGLLPTDQVTYRTVVDMSLGICYKTPWDAVRILNFKVG